MDAQEARGIQALLEATPAMARTMCRPCFECIST